MGVLRVDHPDIEEFVHAKQNSTDLLNFNISIAITDRFMECVAANEPFPLVFEGETYREINAGALWEMIMRSTWDWAEPGVLFIDRINEMNNLAYCETIAATNPCAEQPLPPFGACLLGSFNLVKYIDDDLAQALHVVGAGAPRSFNWEAFIKDIPPVVRAMDNIVDRAIYPLYEQEKEAKAKRRMGIGITGLANAAEALGFPYGSPSFLDFEEDVLERLNQECYASSIDLAHEKGSFPMLDRDKYCESKFLQSAFSTNGMIDRIANEGVRNSHLTSIAPTGTISFTADNISSAIEPVFAYHTDRTIIMPEGERVERVEDYGYRVFGVEGKQTKDVTAEEHLDVLTVASKWVDSAVSKTCNVSPDMAWDDFKNIYFHAWERGNKGCTTFNSGGKRYGILNVANLKFEHPTPEEEATAVNGAACFISPDTGMRSCE